MKKVLSVFLVLSMACVAATTTLTKTVYAGATIPVVYEAETIAYPLTLEVEGKGSVNDGQEDVTKTKQYELKIDKSMTFELKPEKDNKVEKVLLNGADITSSVKDSKVTVDGAEKDQTLKVVFGSQASNKATGKLPHTGDTADIMKWVGLLVLALAGMMALASAKKNRKKEE